MEVVAVGMAVGEERGRGSTGMARLVAAEMATEVGMEAAAQEVARAAAVAACSVALGLVAEVMAVVQEAVGSVEGAGAEALEDLVEYGMLAEPGSYLRKESCDPMCLYHRLHA